MWLVSRKLKNWKREIDLKLKQQSDWLNIVPKIGCESENVNVTKVIEEDKDDDDVNNLSDETVPDDNIE